jgi:hypothetical protein
MARRLTTTIALVLALGAAGCGKDDTSDTTANGAVTTSQISDAAKAGTSTGGSKKSSGSKDSSGSKTSSGSKKRSGSKTSSGSKRTSAKKKTSASKTSSDSKQSGSKSSSGSKQSSGSNTPAAATGGSPSGAAGDADPRLAVLTTVRRYQKDFVDGDSNDACLLLTAAGRKQMIAGGRGQTCAESVKRILDQARDSDIELIKETRAGIHVDDVRVRGGDATVSIGKGQRLRLIRQGGRWLVDDPSP